MEVEPAEGSKTFPHTQTLEGMTVIDEVIDDSEKKDSAEDAKQVSTMDYSYGLLQFTNSAVDYNLI